MCKIILRKKDNKNSNEELIKLEVIDFSWKSVLRSILEFLQRLALIGWQQF